MRFITFLVFTFLTPNLWAGPHQVHLSELTSSYYNSYGYKNHYLKNISGKRKALLILPGMSEPAAKYWELYKDLKPMGYDIYIWDHNGHGQSDYIPKDLNPQKIHIDSYASYSQSLRAFLKGVRTRYKTIDIIAHSMGAHIITRVIYKDSQLVDKLILSAPMYQIKLGGLPSWLIQPILWTFYSKRSWAPSQGKYKYRGLDVSKVSQSKKRIDEYHQLLLEKPELQRGGVTAGWILASLASTNKLANYKNWSYFKVPTLMLFAGNDVFVDNKNSEILCNKIKNCTSKTYMDAKHEILMEKDVIRKKALNAIRAFLKNPVKI